MRLRRDRALPNVREVGLLAGAAVVASLLPIAGFIALELLLP